ncbi:MAG: hypothetical protein LBF97_08410 [Elusimicrobiota bacterium]|nr:hypothetical protein [Elusimicrobiota bacterium]
MAINEKNVGPLIDNIASFIAFQFDNLPFHYTVTQVRSAICKVKKIKNSIIYEAVESKLKIKPYKNLTASMKAKKEKQTTLNNTNNLQKEITPKEEIFEDFPSDTESENEKEKK